jgi:hypothetical protein
MVTLVPVPARAAMMSTPGANSSGFRRKSSVGPKPPMRGIPSASSALRWGATWDPDLSWARLLQEPQHFGVDLYCQVCMGKIAFGPGSGVMFIEWDVVIECYHCGAYIKLVLPEGLQMPRAPKDFALHLY